MGYRIKEKDKTVIRLFYRDREVDLITPGQLGVMILFVILNIRAVLYLTFLVILLYINERTGIKEPDVRIMQPSKRQYRELDDETKQKISLANRNRPKSDIHKQRISQSMKKYWEQIPYRPVSGDVTTYQG